MYSNFNTKEKEKFSRLFIHRRLGLRKAFEIVGGHEAGMLDYETFQGKGHLHICTFSSGSTVVPGFSLPAPSPVPSPHLYKGDDDNYI